MQNVAALPGFDFKKPRRIFHIPKQIQDGLGGWVEDTSDLQGCRERFVDSLTGVFAAAADFLSVQDDAAGHQISIFEAAPSIAERARNTARLLRLLEGDDPEDARDHTPCEVEAVMHFGVLRQSYLDQGSRQPDSKQVLLQAQYGCRRPLELLYKSIETYNQVKIICQSQTRELFKAHRLGFERRTSFDTNTLEPMFHIRANSKLQEMELKESKTQLKESERELEMSKTELERTKIQVANLEGQIRRLNAKHDGVNRDRETLKRQLAVSDDRVERLRKKVRGALDDHNL
ncbi:hypothetical protein D7B24_008702 [Verticillium nonalfalfae]|uniref:Uncharacterized protein n=1 Tax=Verticillium nonalfalfae TaxID=1051616 RepID=A0A3M9YMP8_9PEZI|nr:uncharacterized protein D7B24_008702 [Verticillium nonalfalfae]RNJ60320.1 hypothetical protein D7B24_008702 [Verticillium nonalfalfae]